MTPPPPRLFSQNGPETLSAVSAGRRRLALCQPALFTDSTHWLRPLLSHSGLQSTDTELHSGTMLTLHTRFNRLTVTTTNSVSSCSLSHDHNSQLITGAASLTRAHPGPADGTRTEGSTEEEPPSADGTTKVYSTHDVIFCVKD